MSSWLFPSLPPRQEGSKMPLSEPGFPKTTVKGLVTSGTNQFCMDDWLPMVCEVRNDPDILTQMDSCYVDSVMHFRREGDDGKSVHEKVAFSYHVEPSQDRRIACLHHMCIEPYEPLMRNRGAKYGSQFDSSTSKKEHQNLLISGTLYQLGLVEPTYHLLQSFDVPPDTPFPVLDALILSSVITQSAHGQLELHRVCMWFATMFFLAAHRIADSESRVHPINIIKTPHFHTSAGQYLGQKLLDQSMGRFCYDECIFPDVDAVSAWMRAAGVARDEVDILTKSIIMDFESSEPVRDVLESYICERAYVRSNLKAQINVILENRPFPAYKRHIIAEQMKERKLKEEGEAKRRDDHPERVQQSNDAYVEARAVADFWNEI